GGADGMEGKAGGGIGDKLEGRTAEPVEEEAPERFKALIAGKPKTDQELELRLRLEIGAPGAAVELVFELGERVLIELRFPQFEHGFNRRHHPMAARLSKERGVVTL